ncbi:hypothetical protein ACES2I_11765 [Bdellovibrio bacteriovorus]|uniref:hypothetical protein n=1 Tax=Bdellovibrio bacteriovorus TaxID=959 RepID=UPI0035A727FA
MSVATPGHLQKFKLLCEELSSMLEQEGWSVRPYSQDTLPYFQQLNEPEQAQATDLMNQYLEICRSVHRQGRRIKDMSFLVKTALDYYGYKISQEGMEQLVNKEGRIVEFYSHKHTQFFRSFNFFEFCSYTIEDIFCRSWPHLYSRAEEVTMRILEQANYVLSGRLNQPVIITEVHKIQERVSLERLQMYMTRLYLEPLIKDGKVEGLIAIEDCVWDLADFTI